MVFVHVYFLLYLTKIIMQIKIDFYSYFFIFINAQARSTPPSPFNFFATNIFLIFTKFKLGGVGPSFFTCR